MKNLFILAFVLGSLSSFAQNRFTISGYISDDANGEALVAANIWSPDARVGTSTNGYGFFSLTLPSGKHIIAEREQALAERLFYDNSVDSARELVLAHLRFVVLLMLRLKP